ncbi:MAG: hypothetical protein VZR00_02855 [Lachnospiraceae bacterium]|jgi:hypothetical protein|nr:hypothetical protein [Lachnospiraceae bacterium]MEE3460816.1 hypothetical protein [Lachnospiraceae bacterium]
MLIVSKNVRMDEKIAKHKSRYIRRLNKKHPGLIYVITAPANDLNLMDIYSGEEVYLSFIKRERDLRVIGIASSRESALEMVRQMTDEIYKEYGTIDAEVFRKALSQEVES